MSALPPPLPPTWLATKLTSSPALTRPTKSGVTPDNTAQVKAGELVNYIAAQVGGKGGGKADMAMAGGTEPAKLPAALASVQAWVAAKVG